MKIRDFFKYAFVYELIYLKNICFIPDNNELIWNDLICYNFYIKCGISLLNYWIEKHCWYSIAVAVIIRNYSNVHCNWNVSIIYDRKSLKYKFSITYIRLRNPWSFSYQHIIVIVSKCCILLHTKIEDSNLEIRNISKFHM